MMPVDREWPITQGVLKAVHHALEIVSRFHFREGFLRRPPERFPRLRMKRMIKNRMNDRNERDHLFSSPVTSSSSLIFWSKESPQSMFSKFSGT